MINPDKVTNFHQTQEQLEEFTMFWVGVAGKTAHVIARRMDAVLTALRKATGLSGPYECVRAYGRKGLAELLQVNGIGCFNNKAGTIYDLACSGLDLKTCTYQDLRRVKGMGQKTTRCFLIHSRPDAEEAGLDTHIMGILIDEYPDVLRKFGIDPGKLSKSTPTKKLYDLLTPVVVSIFKSEGMTAAEWDLGGWKRRRRAVANMVS